MKIAIGVPNYGIIKAKTAYSLIEMIRLNKYDFLPIFQYGSVISENIEVIVEVAQKTLCSHILFIEYDMVFAPDTLSRLLAHDKDIIGTTYNFRFLPSKSIVKFLDEKEHSGLCEVSGLGTGCLLVKTSVFAELKRPYFPTEFNERGIMTSTQDIGFCEKARKSGFKVWCDTSIVIKHIGDFLY